VKLYEFRISEKKVMKKAPGHIEYQELKKII
jgi:hypothetical protein